MDYSLIMDPSEPLEGKSINVSQFSDNVGLPRGKIRDHVPQDMRMYNNPPPKMMMEEVVYPPPQIQMCGCRDVFDHVETCPICASFYKRDKFYMMIIAFLVLIIFYLLHKGK